MSESIHSLPSRSVGALMRFGAAAGARTRAWIGLGLIALAACFAYRPALTGQFLWDDDAHVTKPALQSGHGLSRIWFEIGATQQYYPLLHSFFWFQHKLFGDAPLPYHLVNLLLHLAAAGLVYTVLRRSHIPGAMLATAIFALHPVQVETVAWITEQKNTLSAVFYLGAMLAYLHFDESRSRAFYALALGLFVLGVMSKTVTATLPAALLLLFWYQRGRISRREVVPLVPFFALGAAAGLLTAWVEHHLIGAQGDDYNLSLVDRFLLAGRVVWFYLGKLVWPSELIFFYPRWTIDASRAGQWLYPLAAIGTTIALWAIRDRWRAPLAAWLFFVGTLSPVLGFLNVYPFKFSFVADHFQYLACLGPIVLASAGVVLVIERLPTRSRALATCACLVFLGILVVRTREQSEFYRDPETLYRSTIDRNPSCWLVHNNLGVTLARTNRLPEGIQYLQESLRLRPDDPFTHINLGHALVDAGRPEAAIGHCLEALRLRPDDAEALTNLGYALNAAGRSQEAIQPLLRALRVDPDLPEAHLNLGSALVRLDRTQEAIEHFQSALRLRPGSADAQSNLGQALLRSGRAADAVDVLKQAVQNEPNSPEALCNLGVALQMLGRGSEAIPCFESALRLQPDIAEVHNNLGNELRSAGRLDEALHHLEQATQLKPDYLEAWGNLSLTHDQMNHRTQAIAAAQQALEVARSRGNTTVIAKIEAWLQSHPSGAGRTPSVPEPARPPASN